MLSFAARRFMCFWILHKMGGALGGLCVVLPQRAWLLWCGGAVRGGHQGVGFTFACHARGKGAAPLRLGRCRIYSGARGQFARSRFRIAWRRREATRGPTRNPTDRIGSRASRDRRRRRAKCAEFSVVIILDVKRSLNWADMRNMAITS